MFKKPNAILFDLDGTLLDTARDLGNALNQILKKLERPTIDYEVYRNIASDGAKGMLELGLGGDLKNYDFAVLRQQFLDFYETNICVDTDYFLGIESLLLTLNQKNIPWGIVTNKPEFLTLQLVTAFPLLQNCGVIISGDTLSERKPHPLPLLHAEEKLALDSPNTWYIGDAERDIQAANAANMHSVIAQYGYISDIKQTSSWNADLSIRTPSELLDYF
ncbi:HAD family hydrolase [Paraglaciecola psychrophila]|uniref:Phosphoglycolate phosphatase n=1 Tax=Paraglaciecola psychrophila 170 TaxID=1129794 RepID=K6YWT4_9ALTE|nr:HAD-IA family hydrolase [Paraglaciecola psychrophila]AGH44635.1 phosphoglycolate phosphatase [Paraglaciecola psychrophila 170]GAC37174.1 phosphoglycolate phosphatase [Paraglaciecola psychrophila 170]